MKLVFILFVLCGVSARADENAFQIRGDIAGVLYNSLETSAQEVSMGVYEGLKKQGDGYQCLRLSNLSSTEDAQIYICDLEVAKTSFASQAGRSVLSVIGRNGSTEFYEKLRHPRPVSFQEVGHDFTEAKNYDGFRVIRAIGAWYILEISKN